MLKIENRSVPRLYFYGNFTIKNVALYFYCELTCLTVALKFFEGGITTSGAKSMMPACGGRASGGFACGAVPPAVFSFYLINFIL